MFPKVIKGILWVSHKHIKQNNDWNRTKGGRSRSECMKTHLLESRFCHAMWCKVTGAQTKPVLAHKQWCSFCHSPAAIGQGEDIRCTWEYHMFFDHLTHIVWKTALFIKNSDLCIIISYLVSQSMCLNQWWQHNLIKFSISDVAWTQTCNHMVIVHVYVCAWISSFIFGNHYTAESAAFMSTSMRLWFNCFFFNKELRL